MIANYILNGRRVLCTSLWISQEWCANRMHACHSGVPFAKYVEAGATDPKAGKNRNALLRFPTPFPAVDPFPSSRPADNLQSRTETTPNNFSWCTISHVMVRVTCRSLQDLEAVRQNGGNTQVGYERFSWAGT